MATMSVVGSKSQTAHDDTKDFIRGLEMSARKVLAKANKRRMEELHRQQSMAKRIGTAEVDPPKKFVVEVPPGVDDWGDQLADRTMEIASTGMTVGVRATRGLARHRFHDGTNAAAGTGLPLLGATGTSSVGISGDGGRPGSMGKKLPQITRSVGSLTFGAPPRANTSAGGRPRVAGEGSAGGGKAVRAAVPAAKIDECFTVSPLFTAAMMNLTKPPKRANAPGDDPLSGAAGEDEEAQGGIANMRVVNASKIIGPNGRGGRSRGSGGATLRKPRGGGAEIEGQGVTSWSSDDLRVKYRAEREREEAYQAFRLEEQVAEALDQDYGETVAVPEVDRHPLYVAYYAQLERENARCLLRASARNKMKRFITDVHTIWLTNLAHHPEHRQLARGVTTGHMDGQSELGTTTTLRRGLDGGRDSAAIAASHSQIQSVQPERAFRGAIFYTSESKSKAKQKNPHIAGRPGDRGGLGGWSPSATEEQHTSAIVHENGVNNQYDGVDLDGSESPALLPCPDPAPALVVVACERRRLAPAPTAGGGTRRSIGGAGGRSQRRSVGGGSGGGQAGTSSAVSLSDLCTRMLRVVRFEPSALSRPPGPSTRNDTAITDGSTQLSPLLQPLQEAVWMISSFHPYDGSETQVFVGDSTVANVVGKAVAAPGPLAAWMDGSQTNDAGGGARRGVGQRLLALRRGMRVPVLGRDGRVVGYVLSVVEVFVSSCPSPPGTSASSGALGPADDHESATVTADSTVLEVTAYPAALSSLRWEHQQSNGRRRVVLTAESLWRRRRQQQRQNPNSLREPPPSKAPICWWVLKHNRDTSSEVVSGVDRTAKNDEEEEEKQGRQVQGGASAWNGQGLATSNSAEAGEVAQSEGEGANGALECLMGMVAFGPSGGVEGEEYSAPLLLRPSQSFGPEGPTKPPPEVEAVAAAGREWAGEGAVRGGAALLECESKAEVLLSLVQMGSDGRGQGPVVSVHGVSSSLMLGDIEGGRAQAWEEEADRVVPLSMRVCGRRSHIQEVPGTCNVGKMGLTFTYPQATERTQAVAAFFRDASISSSDSVIVVVALALDTPRLTPLVTAWERGPTEPGAAPDEDILGIVPQVMIPPGMVLQATVISDVGDRSAPNALILTAAEKRTDYSPLHLPGSGLAKEEVAAVAVAAAREASERGVKHRRDWIEVDELGFRRYAVYQLLEPDGHMQTLSFGVTKRAALPNTAAVCGRSTFHSEQRCMEQLCRQRTSRDYAYVSANTDHRGPSDPGSYSVTCKHERMKALLRTGLESYNAEMARVAVERERLAKDAALQAKVEIGKAQLANRRAREDAAARSLARKADAQFLKTSAVADRSRHKWELRLQDSRLLEARGSWEKRKDSGGSVFFCCTADEVIPEPFSWDPPACWDTPEGAENVTGGGHTEAVGDDWSDSRQAGNLAPDGSLADLSSLRLLGVSNSPGDDGTAPLLPREYTEEEKVSLAVTRLAQNEELLGALAWRLGIPVADIRHDGREPPLARDRPRTGEGARDGKDDEDEEEIEENRDQIELGEHDEASDSDGERGDAKDPPGPLPQDHSDLRRIRVAERRRRIKAEEGHGYQQQPQSSVPPLPLAEASQGKSGRGLIPSLPPHGLPAAESLEAQIKGLGWRRLGRAALEQKFLEKVLNPRMQGPRLEVVNTSPKPRPTGTTDPTKATKQSEDFSVPVGVMFIADVVEEHARVLHEAERRMKREELLDGEDGAEFDPARFAANGPQEFTTMERRLMALAEDDGRSQEEVKDDEGKAKAVIATKTGNLSDLEALLYADVPVDAKDSNGNTLLLLAAQQGNKRIIKFLLRKGATMNHQNMDGNTVLHFCNATGREDLAQYLMAKGADDSLLNSEGLTCYEGLQSQLLEAI